MNLDLIQQRFLENFALRGELGASVSIWQDGRELLSLDGGFRDRKRSEPWDDSTLVLVWSATKAFAAASLLEALHRKGIPLSDRVAEFWPEFGQAGKEGITIAELLSHRAGLAALHRDVSVFDHEAVCQALCEQAPEWTEGHGYHPRTFGYLLDELLRRIEGRPLHEFWQTEFVEPLGLEAWIGIPPALHPRVASVFPAKMPTQPRTDPFSRALSDPSGLTARAFISPKGLHSVASMNAPEVREGRFPAFGGIASARGLAKFYSDLLTRPWLGWLTTPLVSGFDRVLQMETAFSAGVMMDPMDADGRKGRCLFGSSTRAFGHPGAGGSVAFADPESGIAFAYIMNQMEPGVLPNEKSLGLIEAL